MKLRLGITLWILSWVPYGLIFGLSGAWLSAAWTGRSALECLGSRSPEPNSPKPSRTVVGRVLRPSLWNAIRHGKDIEATNSLPGRQKARTVILDPVMNIGFSLWTSGDGRPAAVQDVDVPRWVNQR